MANVGQQWVGILEKPTEINQPHMWGRGAIVSALVDHEAQQQRLKLLTALHEVLSSGIYDLTNTTTVFGSVPLNVISHGLELGDLEWSKEIAGQAQKYPDLQNKVVNPLRKQVEQMLRDSGQLDMLAAHAQEGFHYDVSLDYYHLRALADVGFHKDTLGKTLFIHLAFSNDKSIFGPEWIVDMGPGAIDEAAALWQHEATLPDWFKKDLLNARGSWKHFAATNGPASDAIKIWGEVLQPFGTVSFNDPLIIHTTPDITSREKALINKLIQQKQFVEESSGKKYYPLPEPELAIRPRSYSQDKLFDGQLPDDTKNTPRSFIRLEVRAIQNTNT